MIKSLNIKNVLRLVLLAGMQLCMLVFGCAFAGESGDGSGRMNYAWASKRMDAPIWGIKTGDLDGDGVPETVLLKRRRISIGYLDESGFREKTSCTWPGDVEAAKIYLMDLDGDIDDEILLSAVSLGRPSSMALDYGNGECRVIFAKAPLSVRVIDYPVKMMIGQWWSSNDYFSGPVYEMILANGKLKKGKRLDLPWRTKLYQFSLNQAEGDMPSVVAQGSPGYLEIRQGIKRRFKRIWRSGEKFGGSINLISAETRKVLGEVKSEYAVFDVPPVVFQDGSRTRMVAVHHDMPVHGVVGLRPYVRSAEVYGFKGDPALGFVEEFRTVMLPGAVIDYTIDNINKNGAKRLLVLVQEGVGYFLDDVSSAIFAFELPVPSR